MEPDIYIEEAGRPKKASMYRRNCQEGPKGGKKASNSWFGGLSKDIRRMQVPFPFVAPVSETRENGLNTPELDLPPSCINLSSFPTHQPFSALNWPVK